MTEIDQIVKAITEGAEDDFDIKDTDPSDEALALDLMNRGWMDASITVERSSHHYVHHRSTGTEYNVSFADEVDEATAQRMDALISGYNDWLKDRMVDWNYKIYQELEASYDSMFEDEYVEEEIRANERKYDEEGNDDFDGDFDYDQLSPEAKKRARESWMDDKHQDPDNFWAEHVIAEWKWLLAEKGFGNIDIGWSGFGSQGDGASFTGRVDDWQKFFFAPDPLDFPEQDRQQLNESIEDEDDFKDLDRSDRKPWGYLLKSQTSHTDSEGKVWPSPYPWFNRRWSDSHGCCGNFRRYIGDATVFKRLSAAQQYSSMEVVPIYDNPRVYGEKVLSPTFEPKPSHTFRTLRPGEPLGERYGGAAKERAIWYHGTSAALIPRIMSEGLIPDPKKRAWAEDPQTSIVQPTRKTTFGIGLTNNFGSASLDGSRAAKRDKANTAFVCVELQPRSLIADEDDVSSWVKGIAPHLTDSVYHHIWPYFMEKYRGMYRGYRVSEAIAEAMADDDDFDVKDVSSFNVSDHYTESADKQKAQWIEDALKMLMFKLKDPSPELKERVRELLASEMYLAMLTRSVSYASNSSHDRMKWESEWRDWFSTSETPPIPNQQQAEHGWHMAVEHLARTLKNYTRKSARNSDWSFDTGGRALQRIGFKGANRIICIVERIDGQKEQEYHSRMLVHYGQPPEQLIKDWQSAIGPLREGDIVYKNAVQESDEDFKDLIDTNSYYVRWTWSGGPEKPPFIMPGFPYQKNVYQGGPFHTVDQAYEWARAHFSDALDKLDDLVLIAVDEHGTMTSAFYIDQNWGIKRYGQMPDGTVLGESDEDLDIKEVTSPEQRWLYIVSPAHDRGELTHVRYYVTEDPAMTNNRALLTQAVMQGKAQVAAMQTFPRMMPIKEVEQWAQAQIRAFQKHGHFDKRQHPNAWAWMRELRKS